MIFDMDDVRAIAQAALKGIVVGVLLTAVFMLCGCGEWRGQTGTTYEDAGIESQDMSQRFVSSVSCDRFRIIIDTEEGVQYLAWSDGGGTTGVGGITVLVDKYGNPILADGYSRNEVGMSEDRGE